MSRIMNALNADILNTEDFSCLTATIGHMQESWFQNVYPYITEECQLHCSHCYLGNRLERAAEMSLDQIFVNLEIWKALGGRKLCFLGGEPTLHPQFEEAVRYANRLGYEKVLLDTNGLSIASRKLGNLDCIDLTYIQVSLDGASSRTHDRIRSKGTFKIVIDTIRELCERGFDTRIICTVNKANIRDCLGILSIADDLGVSLVKYHIFSGIGRGRKRNQWVLNPYEWTEFVNVLLEQKGKYRAKILYQPAYAGKELGYQYLREGYRGCIGRNLDRASIFPDGKAYVCSYLFDTDLNFSNVENGQVRIEKRFNELNLFVSQDDTCNSCQFNEICAGGCPAEKIVTGSLPCKRYPGIFPVCRLWKSTV